MILCDNSWSALDGKNGYSVLCRMKAFITILYINESNHAHCLMYQYYTCLMLIRKC